MRHFLCTLEDVTRKLWEDAALSNYRGEIFTHADVAAEIARFHILFKQIGIRKGDKIAIVAKNSAQWATAFLASATYHAVAVPLLADFTSESIQDLVNHSDSVLLFTDNQHWCGLHEEQLPLLKAVINVEDFTCMYASNEEIKRIFDDLDNEYKRVFPTGLTPEMIHYACDDLDELTVINYTSGTTGQPKGVMLSARSISSNICYSHRNIPVSAGDKSICMLPLAHMYGLTIEFLYAFLGGANVYFLTKTPSPSVLMQAFADIRPFILISVPLVMEKIVKNKVAPPFKQAEFDIMYGKGISREGDVLDLAVSAGLVDKAGAWFAYNGEKIGQGRENAKQYLADNPEVFDELEHRIRAMQGWEAGADGASEAVKENEPGDME